MPATAESPKLKAWATVIIRSIGLAPETYVMILDRLPAEVRKVIVLSFCPKCAARVYGTPCEICR